MARYTTRIAVGADPQTVFDALSRFDRAEEWDPSVRDGAMLTSAPVALGSRFRLVIRILGRDVCLEYEVVELTPRRSVTFHAETGAAVSHDVITFAPSDDGTLVVYDARVDLRGVARLFAPVVALGFRRFADRGAAGLRRWLATLAAP